MKLYHSKFTRSGRARWMLEELEVPYEVAHITFSKGEHRTPEYLAINPHGVVPSLVDGALTVVESSAIVMHLADKYPAKGLAPAPGTDDRARYYRWAVYIPATVDPVLEVITAQTRFLPADKRSPEVLAAAQKKWANIAKVLEEAVDGRAFVVGESFTGADVIVGSAIGWVGFLGMLGDHPKLAAYYAALQARPGYQRAHAD